MTFEPKSFESIIGAAGFSEQLLRNHFALYQGYVANANKVLDALAAMLREGKFGAEFSELRRRLGWEFNGMRLHELYFGNIAKGGSVFDRNSNLARKIVEQFGAFENWERDFKSVGMIRGIGWAVLCYDAVSGKLFNIWVNEHDAGHLSGAVPLLVMDVFEHAYMTDYGIKKADYIEAFFKVIDWNAVMKRFGDVQATKKTVAE